MIKYLFNFSGHCARCFVFQFPDESVSKFYRRKEKHVSDHIQEKFSHIDIKFNKQVEDGCSKRRPDILIEMGSHILIVEVDENQHRNYNTSCEVTRLNELYTDLGDRPIVFIRFNPDKYYNENGRYVKSCFKRHGNLDIPIVAEDQKEQWNERLHKLVSRIKYYMKTVPKEQVIEEYLYYDEVEYTDSEDSDDSDTD
jgi:hypothetical protein